MQSKIAAVALVAFGLLIPTNPAAAQGSSSASATAVQAADTSVAAAKYWSCSRIENEFVSIVGAWAMSPQMQPTAIKATRKLAKRVKNKATRRDMKDLISLVKLNGDITAPDSSAQVNEILTRVRSGKC